MINLKLLDSYPNTAIHPQDVVRGLRKSPKQLHSKWFYDQYGSELFERITRLPEYYPTRTEQHILDTHIEEIRDAIGPEALLIELGSGSSTKTRTLLEHLDDPVGYVPVDISRDHLLASAQQIAQQFPQIEVLPLCADYEEDFPLPQPSRPPRKRVIFYPGSTIGNFHPSDVVPFFHHLQKNCGPNCELLVGVDTKKDTRLLHLAYNDADGITAEFNLNILRHLNKTLGADFAIDQFSHLAFYNEQAGRIEMHLVSRIPQTVHISGEEITFEQRECVWTESSYKYTPQEFAELASRANFSVHRVWTDSDKLFSLQYICPGSEF